MAQQVVTQPAVELAMAPSFLSLALELRLKIYRNLLIYDREIGPQCQDYFEPFKVWYGPEQNPGLSPAILRTRRQTYDETAPILYEENTFYYRCHADANREYGGWNSRMGLECLTK